jgi:hypothetical protein
MTLNSDSARNQPLRPLEKVDALIEQALDLSPTERKELIETLLFVDMVLSPEPDSDPTS